MTADSPAAWKATDGALFESIRLYLTTMGPTCDHHPQDCPNDCDGQIGIKADAAAEELRKLVAALRSRSERLEKALRGVRAFLDGEDGCPGVGLVGDLADYELVPVVLNAGMIRTVRAALQESEP